MTNIRTNKFVSLLLFIAFTLCYVLSPKVGNASEDATRVQLILTFEQGAMLSVNGKNKKMRAGQTWSGVKLVSVQGATATIRVNEQTQVLQRGGSGLFAGTSPDEYRKERIDLIMDPVGLFFVNAQIAGKQQRFIVDTGANLVVLNSRLADQLGIDYLQAPRSVASTASGRVSVYIINLPEMDVGGVPIRNIETGIVEGGFPEVPLLGTSALNKFVMQRDGETMQLTPK